MSSECPFFNGDGFIKCNPIQAIPAAKVAIGYDGESLLTVQKELCRSTTDTSRETVCPAFGGIKDLGLKSQFAKPITNNH